MACKQGNPVCLISLPRELATNERTNFPSWRPLVRSHVERRCSNSGLTQSCISPNILEYTKISLQRPVYDFGLAISNESFKLFPSRSQGI